MATTATFYTLAKRDNSTAQPTGQGTQYDVELKAGCSLVEPVLILESATVPAGNCISWEGRYYKVRDVRSVRNNIWEISAVTDVLATYKANIQAASAFVAYDTAANTEISDHRLSVNTTQSTSVNSGSFSTIGSGTCAVLSITGVGSTSSWAMPIGTARTILDNLQTWLDGANVLPIPQVGSLSDVVEAVETLCENAVKIARQLMGSGKVADCIKSAVICPWPASICGESASNIELGEYTSNKSGYRLDPQYGRITDNVFLNIPWATSDWRRNSPYTELYLYIPYIGVIALSPSDLVGESQIEVNAKVYLTTGDAIFRVKTGTKEIAQYTTNLAAPFTIGASNVNPVQALTAVGAAVGGAIATFATSGAAAVAAGTAGIAGVTNNISGHPSTIGTNAGGANLVVENTCKIIGVFHDTTVAPSSVSAVIGTPTMSVKSLSGMTGYVETRNFSVSGDMTEGERTEINRLMDGGVYIE